MSVEAFFSNKIENYHADNHGGCSRTQRMVGFEGNTESKSQEIAAVNDLFGYIFDF